MHFMKKLSLVVGLLLCSLATLLAQRTITGTVTDEQGDALIGATVLVKGTSTGTVTDVDGTYSININNDAKVLLFSYTGFETVEQPIGVSNTIDLVMLAGVTFDEIVVTGQGVGIEKKRLTSTVDAITSEQLELAPITQLDQVLQSRLPGTQVRLSSGQPGTASQIRNRGPISANASTTPVIIIDGVRVDNLNSRPTLNIGTGGANSSALADIPIEAIERVEFIRGGAATTLYGADAANGVIQIFTKKGQKGQKARFGYDGTVGVMSGEETFLYFPETADLYYENGTVQQHRLTVDGGSDKVGYSFSGSFYDDDSFNDINQQRRVSMRTGVSAELSPTLSYAASAAFASNWFTRDYNANTSFARFGNIEGGSYGDVSAMTSEERADLKADLAAQGAVTDITEAVRRFQTSQALTWTPFEGFTAKATLGLDNRNSRQRDVQSNAVLIAKGAVPAGTADQGSLNTATRNFISVTTDLSLQYRFDAGDFSFITGGGGQFFREQDEQYLLIGTDLTEGSILLGNTASQTASDFLQIAAFGGFYISENIGFKNKFFLDAAVRWDGNSAFGEDIGLVNIYRLGFSYSLTDEPFMQQSGISDIVSRFSIRANFGQATNFPTPFKRDLLYIADPYRGSVAYTFGNPGNSDLGPEIVDSYEAGFDASFFDARFGVGFTYYDNTTNDAIFTPPSAPSAGQLAQEANVGTVTNKGIELQGYVDVLRSEDFDLTFNASYTTNENLVVDAGGAPEFSVGGFTFLGSFVKEGQALGYFRGSRPTFDAEGNLVDVEANAVLGNPNPTSYGNVGFNFRWKNLTLFGSSDFQRGASGVAVDDVLRYFGGVNDPTRIPANAANESFFDLAGVWVEDADFFKVRNIGISYNIPTANIEALSRLTVGLNFRNPYVRASSSFDPEVTGSGISAQDGFAAGGFGFGTESAPKQVLFNVRIGF
jgi:outer membrane receptor protein involved in Fe transport